MKKITLIAALVFLFGNTANATTVINVHNGFTRPVNISDAEPVVFTERGVEFFVFADGQFDFNTRPATSGDYYYKKGGRNAVNATYGAPGNNANYGVIVEHDNFGRVRRVGNVFINYDAQNRIKRIGSVYMSYNRFALAQVGGLQLIYNRRGQIIDMIGTVKGRATGYTSSSNSYYGPVNNNDNYYYRDAKEEEKIGVNK